MWNLKKAPWQSWKEPNCKLLQAKARPYDAGLISLMLQWQETVCLRLGYF
jgi:hypothetical protein